MIDSNTKLQISHILNDLIEDAFSSKDIELYVRCHIDRPCGGKDIDDAGIDKEMVSIIDGIRYKLAKLIEEQLLAAYFKGQKDTQDRMKNALGLGEEQW